MVLTLTQRHTENSGVMSEQVELTVGEAAEFLGVSVRTLHHWDHIGLLSPGWRTNGNYRLYTPEDMERGQLILMYREAGMPLNQIAEALESGADLRTHLVRQKQLLTQRLGNVQRMMRAVEELLELQEDNMNENMNTHKIKDILGPDWDPEYQVEAEQRWGNTEEWEQSQRVAKSINKDDWAATKAANEQLAKDLVEAAERGVEPGSTRANELAEQHKATVDRWYPCSYAKQVILARMYVQDERFAATYQQQTEYLRDIVEANAQAHGVCLENVSWE